MNEEVTPRRPSRRELREKWLAEEALKESQATDSAGAFEEVPDLSYLEQTETKKLGAEKPQVEASESETPEAEPSEPETPQPVKAGSVNAEPEKAVPWEEPAADTHVRLRRRRQEAFADGEEPAPTQPFSLADLKELQLETAGSQEQTQVETADASGDTKSSKETEPAEKASVDTPLADNISVENETTKEIKDEYSFPDIQPLDEDKPVFDSESGRTVSAQESGQGTDTENPNFEQFLERAIADENTSVHTSTSALILPSFPDTDLQGPLGATGELFVTGSLELPKSLSETGGHSSLIDSFADSEDDNDFGTQKKARDYTEKQSGELFADYDTAEFDSQPKSARKAVSAKSATSAVPTVPVTKQDGKKPLVFGLIAGGVVLVIIGGALVLIKTGILG